MTRTPIRLSLVALSIAFITQLTAQAQEVSVAANAAARSFLLNYSVDMAELPADANSIQVYLPIPPTNSWQKVEDLQIAAAGASEIVRDAEYGNQFLCAELSLEPGEAAKPLRIGYSCRITRFAHDVLASQPFQPQAGQLAERFLKPDALVPIDGVLAARAQAAVGRETDKLKQVQLCFDQVVDSMEYDKSGEGWGRGDALWACDAERGNCTDFHSVFIGMVRSLGIPARFIMGLSLPADAASGEISGYHCWAEFYVDGHGWVPIDASESRKHPEQRELLFGGLDAHRVEFTMGRDISLPGAYHNPRNFVIYPYVEVDGEEFTGYQRRIEFSDT